MAMVKSGLANTDSCCLVTGTCQVHCYSKKADRFTGILSLFSCSRYGKGGYHTFWLINYWRAQLFQFPNLISFPQYLKRQS